MKRVQYNRYGGPEELVIADTEQGMLTDGNIQIRVRAASANPMDWKIRAGAVKMMTGRAFPRGVGNDFAGVVEGVGRDVTRIKVGDHIFGAMTMKASSAFAEIIITGQETAAIMPAGLSFEDAATLPIAGSTAWTALIDTAHLQSGQRVLINGCLGSVGRAAVQIALLQGAKIFGTCSASGVEEAQALGCAEAYDYRHFDPVQYKKTFDLVFDTAGSFNPWTCLRMLTPNGVALHININPIKMIQVLLTPRNKAVIAKTTPQLLARLGELAVEGKLKLLIAMVVPLNEAIAALTKLERTGQPKGKLVIAPNS